MEIKRPLGIPEIRLNGEVDVPVEVEAFVEVDEDVVGGLEAVVDEFEEFVAVVLVVVVVIL